MTLFYVTSAFSLCCAMRPGEDRGHFLAAFAVRRFFRIAPLFYLVLVVSLARDALLFSVTHSPLVVAVNFLFLFNIWPGQETGVAWASWTIGVEVLFYLIFPFVATWTATTSRAILLVIVSLLTAAVFSSLLHHLTSFRSQLSGQLQFGFLHHLPVFMIGILAFHAYTGLSALRRFKRSAGAATLVGAIYLYTSLLNNTLGPAPFLDSYYWQAFIYAAMLLGIAFFPAAVFVNPLTLYLGRISYSIYLIHPLVVYSLAGLYRQVEVFHWSETLRFSACLGVTFPAVVLLASFTHAFIEVPGMRLGRYFSALLERTATPSPKEERA